MEEDSFIYKMPILRAMSPLADTSSDSEDQMSDEPLASTTISPRSSTPKKVTAHVENAQPDLPASQEGRTGEIFVAMKTLLPLTLKQGRSTTAQQ